MADYPSFQAFFHEGDDQPDLLHLGQSLSTVGRVLQAARGSPHLEDELAQLFAQGWRHHLVAALALLPHPQPAHVVQLWKAFDQGSWVTPQLAVIAWLCDDGWEAQAKSRVLLGSKFDAKARAALMALLAQEKADRSWLRQHVTLGEAIDTVLVQDRDDGPALAAGWGQRLTAILDELEASPARRLRLPEPGRARSVLLKLWAWEGCPAALGEERAVEGFLEPLVRAGAEFIVLEPDRNGDTLRAPGLDSLRLPTPYNRLVRGQMAGWLAPEGTIQVAGVMLRLEGSLEPGHRVALRLVRPRLSLSRAHLEDSGAEILAFGARDTGEMEGPVASALLRRAGARLETSGREALARTSREAGVAVLTPAYSLELLRARYVCHIVSIVGKNKPGDPEQLSRGVSRALQMADEAGVKSIAFAALEGGRDPGRCARLMVAPGRRHFEDRPDSPLRVIFCLPTEPEYRAFEAELGREADGRELDAIS